MYQIGHLADFMCMCFIPGQVPVHTILVPFHLRTAQLLASAIRLMAYMFSVRVPYVVHTVTSLSMIGLLRRCSTRYELHVSRPCDE